ncbi:MAG: glutamate--tRNA ligase [Hyphomicrobiaceae bacterium]|nr:glutamate--tRNA ligase [Hyphomicrobiaceae bacterium]MCC0023477.1 glutamate--tRNA ligase [Hyphomicrobiaceae bacterium]
MTTKVITRFAPSPTGYLHIGGARTALFNWAFARKHGGKMLLRIEDTDRARSTEAAKNALLDGLSWLGIHWDGDPISQFERAQRHAEVAHELVRSGKAYYCYATPEELTEMREEQKAKGLPPRYDGRWRDRDPSEAPEGVEPAIRIKAPLEGEIVINDHVQGRVVFKAENLDDLIILRSDGTPTYMHAVVVDDHDMEVTHIIRGDDHLTNTARQMVIYNAMGWDVPETAHVPLIHGPDGAKLSKRHGALGADAYRRLGYLPDAIVNYLARLGWSHGDDEIFSRDQLVEWFDIDDLNKGAARFDFAKLESLNGHYIRAAAPASLFANMRDLAHELEWAQDAKGLEDNEQTILAALPDLQPRAKTVVELIELARFVYAQRPLPIAENAQKHLGEEEGTMISEIVTRLEALSDWDAGSIGALIRSFAEEKELKLGKVAQPLRVALTGQTVSPGVFEVMQLLGKPESLARLSDQAK